MKQIKKIMSFSLTYGSSLLYVFYFQFAIWFIPYLSHLFAKFPFLTKQNQNKQYLFVDPSPTECHFRFSHRKRRKVFRFGWHLCSWLCLTNIYCFRCIIVSVCRFDVHFHKVYNEICRRFHVEIIRFAAPPRPISMLSYMFDI